MSYHDYKIYFDVKPVLQQEFSSFQQHAFWHEEMQKDLLLDPFSLENQFELKVEEKMGKLERDRQPQLIYEYFKSFEEISDDRVELNNLEVLNSERNKFQTEENKSMDEDKNINVQVPSPENNSSKVELDDEIELEEAIVYNKFGFIRKRLGRKLVTTGLHQRKDVVLKSLLRSIHSFYWTDLNNETNYIKQKRKIGIEYYEDCLKTYIQSKFNEESTDNFVLILGSIAFSKDMKNLLQYKSNNASKAYKKIIQQKLKMVNQIKDILYKFSFSRYCKLAKSPEMYKIMTYFYSNKERSLIQDEEIGFEFLIDECITE